MPNLIASQSRTTGTQSAPQRGSHRGLILLFDATALSATPSVDLFLEANIADEWVPVFSIAAPITAVGKTKYVVGLDLGAIQNDSYYTEVVLAPIPSRWRVRTVHADADPITYSVSCTYF